MVNKNRTNTRRARFTGRGFSLIELIAVMTIAAILAAVAVPAMGTLPGTRRKVAAVQTARDVRLAREMAITAALPAWVSFDVPGNSYSIRIEQRDDPGRADAVAYIDPATGREFIQTLGSGEFAGVSITAASIGGGTWVGFDWQGKPLAFSGAAMATAGTITLSGNLQVRIEPETGHVELTP